jgi:4-nitrophenyl phosphatase
MFETALAYLSTPASSTLMIGDRLDTDIIGAHACGIRTALVLSGVATREETAVSPVQPDAIYDDLAGILRESMH